MQVHTLNACPEKNSEAYKVLRETGDKLWTSHGKGSKQEPQCGAGLKFPGWQYPSNQELMAEWRTRPCRSVAVVQVFQLPTNCCWGAWPPGWQSASSGTARKLLTSQCSSGCSVSSRSLSLAQQREGEVRRTVPGSRVLAGAQCHHGKQEATARAKRWGWWERKGEAKRPNYKSNGKPSAACLSRADHHRALLLEQKLQMRLPLTSLQMRFPNDFHVTCG